MIEIANGSLIINYKDLECIPKNFCGKNDI